MALGVSRLLLSLSAMKRFTGGGDVAADFILTQLDDFFLSQEGRLILANQSAFSTADDPIPVSQPVSFFLTQLGDVIIAQDEGGIGLEQGIYDIKSEFDQIMLTQDKQLVTTQDGRFLVYVIPPDIDIVVRQNGIGLLTQDRTIEKLVT